MEKDVERRTQTADDLLAALRRVRAAGSTKPPTRTTTRRRWILGGAALAAVTVALITLFGGHGASTPRLNKPVVLPFVQQGASTAGDEARLEGFHAPGGLLLVLDETKGIPQSAFDAVQGALTGEEAKLLVTSVPGGAGSGPLGKASADAGYRCGGQPPSRAGG